MRRITRYTPYPSPRYTPGRRVLTPANAMAVGRFLGRSARRLFNNRKNAVQSDSPVTYGGGASKPFARQYRKRYRSRRVQRRAKRYYNSFRKALRAVSGVGFQKSIINSSVNATAGPAAQQYLAAHLCSWSSGAAESRETGQRDIAQVVNNVSQPQFLDEVGDGSKLMFDTCIMDLTLTNTSASQVEVDKYLVSYRKPTEFASFGNMLAVGTAAQLSITNAAADKITINTRGGTLFDMPNCLSTGELKILSKEKIFMAAGNTAQFQIKQRKKFSASKNKLALDSYYAQPGTTLSVVFVFKTVAGETGTAALTLAATRAYGFRVDGLSDTGCGVVPA